MEIKPWSKKRKVITTAILAGFIGLSSSLLGIGIYLQQQHKFLKYDKKTILGLLSEDAEFQRAVMHAAKQRTCRNNLKKFQIMYEPPLRPQQTKGQEACSHFSSTHPSGKNISITIKNDSKPREALMVQETKYFQYAHTDSLNHPNRTVSKITGVKNQIPTAIYISEGKTGSFIITYSPISPTLTRTVESLVMSLEDY